MAQSVSVPTELSRTHHIAQHPHLRRGADDQAAAYEAWLARWADVDAAADERAWQQIKLELQRTRRALGQRLLFPE